MAGHQNVRRHWVADGEPVALGILPVGDALCTTILRRMNLLDAPHAILDDPEVEQRAREMREFYASRPPRNPGPDRAELLALIERSRPASPAAYQSVRTAR